MHNGRQCGEIKRFERRKVREEFSGVLNTLGDNSVSRL